MKVLICGSRNWDDELAIATCLSSLPKDTVIIHGGAKGADKLAGHFAKQLGMQVEEYPADWNKYGLSAGPIRNRQMLKEGKPDRVIAFQVGKSRGTQHMVDIARRANIPVTVNTNV